MASFYFLHTTILLLFTCLRTLQGSPSPSCRCLPSQSCWPSAQVWNSFNASLDGALIRVTPLASPCHDPWYNAEACKQLKLKWSDPFWRAEQPSALQAPNYELLGTQGCPLDAQKTSPCLQGALPVYSINVSTASQVQKAVSFAAQYNLRLVVKNTGHDMAGRNTAPGSLSIWMHRLKNITFMDHFLPAGWYFPWTRTVSAVKVEAGVQWEELYEAAYKHDKTVVGAQCSSVGAAGGYAQGGGHSQISPSFGLAADNILEYEVVTADGKLVVANACQNTLLFWALRGGGGGTFGVVISVTYATHPALQGLVYASYSVTASTSSSFLKFLTQFLALNPSLADTGWGGSFLIGNKSLIIQYLLPNKNVALRGDLKLYPSYYDWHRAVQCSGGKCGYPSGSTTLEASRLIPRAVLRNSVFQLAEALVGGGKVSSLSFNSVNPAWRKAILHVLVAGYYPEFSTDDVKESLESKMNEGDSNEPDWQQAFFGIHYKVLKYIKNTVDPTGLFVCKHCVGSEDWSSDLNCRSSSSFSNFARA